MNALGFAGTGLFPLVASLASWLRASTTDYLYSCHPHHIKTSPNPRLACDASTGFCQEPNTECGESVSQGQLSSMGKGAHGRTLCLNLRRMIPRDILCSSQRTLCRTKASFSFLSGHLSNTPFMLIFLQFLIHSLVLHSSSFFSLKSLLPKNTFLRSLLFGVIEGMQNPGQTPAKSSLTGP